MQLISMRGDGLGHELTRYCYASLAAAPDHFVRVEDWSELTPLGFAIFNDDLGLATALREAGARLDRASRRGSSALHLASAYGRQSCARWLLELPGTAIDAARWDGQAPLHLASRNGHAEVARLLVGAGAALDAKIEGGYTPLLLAVSNSHEAIARLLVDVGADLDAKIEAG
ncbi:MAG: ankyrin repeat domain-containing protein [Devosia sp.]|nr:ankyrin repeat domain-containing protein [Devosia sp.]